MTTDLDQQPAREEYVLRDAAVKQLKKKRDLQAHVIAYVMVNLLLNAIWFLTMRGDFYWPVIPLLGWGIGLVFNVWDVYAPTPTETQIRREMNRLSRR